MIIKQRQNRFVWAKTMIIAAMACLTGFYCTGSENGDADSLATAAAGSGSNSNYDSASTLPEPRLIESLLGRFAVDSESPSGPLRPNDHRQDDSVIIIPVHPIPIPDPLGKNKDSDKDGMTNYEENQLMYKFAPYLRFHHLEKSFPSDVHWALAQVNLRHNSDNFCSDRLVYNYGDVTASRLASTTVAGKGSSGLRFCGNTSNRYHTWVKYSKGKSFYMNVPTQIYGGNLANAKCYAHVRKKNVAGSTYVVDYWFYYPYNPAYRGLAGGHQGDWEHVQVRVNADKSLRSMRFYAHGGEIKDRVPNGGGFWFTDAGRPMVYSARWTHASYPESGVHWRSGAAIATPDYTSNDGKVLDCSQPGRTVNIGRYKYPAYNQQWIRYKGYWGFKQTFGRAGGPSGPNMVN